MTEIVEDVLDIVNQIKSIDSNYKVFRNHKLHRFEVVKVYGLNLKTEVVWQNSLDYRLVKKVYMTRKENLLNYVCSKNWNRKIIYLKL